MRYIFKIILPLLLAALMTFQSFCETPTDSVRVYFRVGQTQFDPTLSNNLETVDNFINIVRNAYNANNIDSIVVSGYASPEGASNVNLRLARLRAQTVADLIIQRSDVNPDIIHTITAGVAWDDLRKMVSENLEVPAREKILHILDNVPLWVFNSKGEVIDGRKKRLMDLEGGRPYKWLLANIFPELRVGVAVALYLHSPQSITSDEVTTTPEAIITDVEETSETPEAITTDIEETSETPEAIITDIEETIETPEAIITNIEETIENPEEVAISEDNIINGEELSQAEQIEAPELSQQAEQIEAPEPSSPRPFYMSLKTNMLYDAALVPNVGAEFYVGKNFSIYGEWMYAWWDSNPRHRYWRIYGGDLGARWWFGEKAHSKPLRGHHLGVYAGALVFDFECGDTGYMGGKPGGTLWDRCLINTGFEYGYSLPVTRHLNIDFSIGLGYLGGNYIKYYPFDNDYYSEKKYKMRYFGPTKAEISLIWLIGHGNINPKKGGDK